jgi:hypothetical protein
MARPGLEPGTPRFSGSREAPRSATKGLQIAALAAQKVVPRAPWFGLVSRGFGTPRRPRSPTEAGSGSCLNGGRRLVRGGAPAVGDLLGAIRPLLALGRRPWLGRRERPAFRHRRSRDACARPKGPHGPQSTIPGRPRTEPNRRGAPGLKPESVAKTRTSSAHWWLTTWRCHVAFVSPCGSGPRRSPRVTSLSQSSV